MISKTFKTFYSKPQQMPYAPPEITDRLGSLWSKPPAPAGSPRAGCPGPGWLLSISRLETAPPPRAACASAGSPSQWQGVPCCSEGTSWASVCAHRLWSCHWAPPERARLIPFHPPCRCLYTLVRSPWAFSTPGWRLSLRWTLSSMSMSVSYWGAQHWTQSSRCGLTSAEPRGRMPSLNLLWHS